MPELKTSLSLANATAENLSRHDLLEWVNSVVNGQYKKIEELCSGVAYCQIMELLFPNAIGLKKIKSNAKMDHECLHNLKLFQSAFTKLKFNKSVPIDRLMKGKFQDNFEFLQWFKKFFDTYSAGKENLKVPEALQAAAQNQPKVIRKVATSGTVVGPEPIKADSEKAGNLKTPKNNKTQQEKVVSPSSLCVLQETAQKLTEEILAIDQERNSHYKKLTKIEDILNESIKNGAYVEWCNRALTILYAVDDNTSGGDDDVYVQPDEKISN